MSVSTGQPDKSTARIPDKAARQHPQAAKLDNREVQSRLGEQPASGESEHKHSGILGCFRPRKKAVPIDTVAERARLAEEYAHDGREHKYDQDMTNGGAWGTWKFWHYRITRFTPKSYDGGGDDGGRGTGSFAHEHARQMTDYKLQREEVKQAKAKEKAIRKRNERMEKQAKAEEKATRKRNERLERRARGEPEPKKGFFPRMQRKFRGWWADRAAAKAAKEHQKCVEQGVIDPGQIDPKPKSQGLMLDELEKYRASQTPADPAKMSHGPEKGRPDLR